MIQIPAYDWYGYVIRWVDGDTVEIKIERGFDDASNKRFRLYGVQCPEEDEAGYAESTTYSERACPPGTRIYFKTYKQRETKPLDGNTDKKDSFGRYLALVYLPNTDITLNSSLVASGNAITKYY